MATGNLPGLGDLKGPKFVKERMKLNWNFRRGGGGGSNQKTICGGGLDIYLSNALCFNLLLNICHFLLHCSIFVAQTKALSFSSLKTSKMHILVTVLHTFLMELERRICLNIKTSYPW